MKQVNVNEPMISPREVIDTAARLLTEISHVDVQDGIIRLAAELLIPEVEPELSRWIMDLALMSATQE